jgi:2-dehydropantoate 2-reductase
MRICFIGAGALGCALGGILTEAGSDVVLVARNACHVAALARDGLRITEGGQERTVPVKAATGVEGLAPVDLLVVLVKSYDTRDALMAAAPVVGPDTTILSLQNGLGQEDIIIGLFGRERVIAGKTYAGGVLLGPGHVLAGRKPTYIGELDGSVTPRIEAIAAEFNRAGLETQVSTHIAATIWDKLLINVATGAWCAVTGAPYGVIYATPEIRECAVAAVAEAMAVAAASGVTVSIRSPEEAWEKAGAGLPADFKTSMLQSIEAGRRTEIDFINGAVVRAAEKYGVPTPVNRTLVACVKGIERRFVGGTGEV